MSGLSILAAAVLGAASASCASTSGSTETASDGMFSVTISVPTATTRAPWLEAEARRGPPPN